MPEPTPADNDTAPVRPIYTFGGTLAYRDWLDALAAHAGHAKLSHLIAAAIEAYAKSTKFPDPPPSRLKSSLRPRP